MKKDIIINGVSVNELKKQRDAIREGAAKVVAENLALAQELTRKLGESEDKEEIKALALEAYEALEAASVVSAVGGITFYLPFSYEYCRRGEVVFSTYLEDGDNELISEVWDEGIDKLASLFYKMEKESRGWNSSYC